MAKKTESTAVAVLGANDVPMMLEKVIEQIKLITGKLPDAPKTVKEIPGFGKVEEITSLDNLIKAHSSVLSKERAYTESAAMIIPGGIKVPKFTINGMVPKTVFDHMALKAIEIGNKEKLDALNEIKKTLEENLSAEAKLSNGLKKINGIMADLVGEIG